MLLYKHITYVFLDLIRPVFRLFCREILHEYLVARADVVCI